MLVKPLNKKEQDRILIADVQGVLSCREWINAQTNRNFDKTRILGVVAAGQGAENYLPYTIPKIIQQISEIGKCADIIIGLNNGFECQNIIYRLSLLSDVQVIHLYTGERISNTSPAQAFDNLKCEGEPYYLSNNNRQQSQHRIFVIHQRKGPYSAGKIRVLGDIYGLLLNSIYNGWIPPACLVTFDAESQFLVNQAGAIPDPESNGLSLIVRELENRPEIDILGTRNKFAVYRQGIIDGTKVLLPNFSEEIPPLQLFIDLVHGNKHNGFKWMPGGGTVGRTDVIISLLAVIAQRYPGIRIEDTHLTILGKNAGFIGGIFMDVVATNRTPSLADMTTDESPKPAWMEQMYRWNAGCKGLELYYGKHNVSLISGNNFNWGIFKNIIVAWITLSKETKRNLPTLLNQTIVGVVASIKIRNKAAENPDILQGSGAKASW